MKTLSPFLVVALAALAGLWMSRPLSTHAIPPEPIPWTSPLSRTEDTGQRIYLRRCALCHGQDRGGFGVNATRLDASPPDLTTSEFRSTHPKPRLIDWINGRRPRPAPLCPNWQSTLSPAESNAIAEYLLTP